MPRVTANLYALFAERFRPRAERTCFVAADGATWTYGDVDELSARFAAMLRAAGVAPGDRVVVQVDKSVGAAALYLGCLRAGAAYTPLNTAYTPDEVAYFLGDAEPKVFVCRPQDRGGLAPIAETAGVADVWALGIQPGADAWADALGHAPDHAVAAVASDDLAAICYTSGTTGRSKGAMLSHANLSSNALALHNIWGFEDGDVLLHALPIFHVHGLFVALHTALLNASTMIFLPSFDARDVRKRLREATILMGVPTYYARLLAEPDFGADDCAGVRLFISGSAPLTAQASDAFFARTGQRILERYGMTEAGMITSNPLDGDRVAGTVGFALPEVEVRVCGDDGAERPRGDVGVLEVKGPNVFQGYWRMPEKNAEDFRADGGFITGDLATMDESGRVAIVGRAKDLIIAGGYNIYPKEIEAVLDAVPGVRESAVVGVPHPDMGEGVLAALVADAAPVADADLQAALDAKLARFKHPRRFAWVDALPRNAMGKVQKNALRERFKAAYAAASAGE